MTRLELSEFIASVAAAIATGNEIIVPEGELTADELKTILDEFGTGIVSVLEQLNNSSANLVDDPASNGWNQNQLQTNNRVHDSAEYMWSVTNGWQYKYECTIAPPDSEGGFEFTGYSEFGVAFPIANFRESVFNDILLGIASDGVNVSVPLGIQADPTGFYSINAGGSVNVDGSLHVGSTIYIQNGYTTINGTDDFGLDYNALNGHVFNTDYSMDPRLEIHNDFTRLNNRLELEGDNRWITKSPIAEGIMISGTTSAGVVEAFWSFGHNSAGLYASGDFDGAPITIASEEATKLFCLTNGSGLSAWRFGQNESDFAIRGVVAGDWEQPMTISSLTGYIEFSNSVAIGSIADSSIKLRVGGSGDYAVFVDNGATYADYATNGQTRHSFYAPGIGSQPAFKVENPGGGTSAKIAYSADSFGANSSVNAGFFADVSGGSENYAFYSAAGDWRQVGAPIYADNTAAAAAKPVGTHYHNGDGVLRIVY